MKYVVTGATSFIGLECISYLLSHDNTVVAVCRQNSNSISSIPEGAEVVCSEMSEYKDLHKQIDEADVFINLAWGGTGHDGRDVIEVQNENVVCTTEAMHAAAKMGCKLFVEAGSQAEYGSMTEPQKEDAECYPFSEYGKAKLKAKENLFSLSEQLGIKYVHLRIFSIFGECDHPWTLVMSAVNKMLSNEPMDLSPCTQNWNFVYVKDAVRMIAILCQKSVDNPSFTHEVYNIASEDTRPLKSFVERIKILTKSSSLLNYGANVSANFVSLQPDMSKTRSVVGSVSEYTFDEVVKRIINKF